MSSRNGSIFKFLALFLLISGPSAAIASDPETLRLKRDLRACVDKSIATANSQNLAEVSAVLSSCDPELQAFLARITDETRLEAIRLAITGYVRTNLEPARVAGKSGG